MNPNKPASEMTLREVYAGLAMQGLLANPAYEGYSINCADCAIEHTDMIIAALATLAATEPAKPEDNGELQELRKRVAASQEAISQTLGRALGYPRFCDDQKNFPGSTNKDGVCVGEHVAETLAEEAAKRIADNGEAVWELVDGLKRIINELDLNCPAAASVTARELIAKHGGPR